MQIIAASKQWVCKWLYALPSVQATERRTIVVGHLRLPEQSRSRPLRHVVLLATDRIALPLGVKASFLVIHCLIIDFDSWRNHHVLLISNAQILLFCIRGTPRSPLSATEYFLALSFLTLLNLIIELLLDLGEILKDLLHLGKHVCRDGHLVLPLLFTHLTD